MPQKRSGPTRVSDILHDLTKSPELTEDAREAIGKCIVPPPPFVPHKDCPCALCHRSFGMIP